MAGYLDGGYELTVKPSTDVAYLGKCIQASADAAGKEAKAALAPWAQGWPQPFLKRDPVEEIGNTLKELLASLHGAACDLAEGVLASRETVDGAAGEF